MAPGWDSKIYDIEGIIVSSLPAEQLLGIIESFGNAPDDKLVKSLAEECKNFDGKFLSDGILFLRNLRDKAVYIGGASDFVMNVIGIILKYFPESAEDQEKRREKLESEWVK